MPVIRVQVFYRLGTLGKWSNVWHCQADDVLDASVKFRVGCEDHLLALLHPACLLVSTLASDPASDAFVSDVYEENGTSGDTAEMLPLFNSVKVIIPTPGFGRPDLKYFKGYITELGQNNTGLTASSISDFDTHVTGMITDMVTEGAPLCSFEGDNYTNVTVQQAVQMRQMHRRRRKTVVTP